jgi:hypothetical protein
MPVMNSNKVYLTLDGVDVAGFMTEVGIKVSNADEDTSAGSGLEHEQIAPGLDSTDVDISLGYFPESVADYITKLRPGAMPMMVYGPELNVAGKPKHQQLIKISSVDGPKLDVKKKAVMFKISAKGADAAIADLYKGATF